MANDLSAVAPKLLAQGLLALRSANLMPALVNNSYDPIFSQKGLTVDVPIPSAIAVQDVVPAATPQSTGDSTPTYAQVTLNQWKEAPFYLTDKDIQQAFDGVIPMQASEAIKAIADTVNAYLFSLYTGVYGYAGTAGTTPFASDTTAATAVRKVLNNQLAPLNDRRIVLNPDAEANALNLRAFQDTSWVGTPQALAEGKMVRKLGFDWFMDQQAPSHTAGTASGATTNTAGYALGVKTVTLASAGTGTIVVGDVFTFAGDSQTYVATSAEADVSNGGTLSFEPGLKKAIATSATAITLKASHAVNLAFHRDAFAFASRPLADSVEGLGNIIQAASDPVSGIALRLEISREHKRTRFSYDLLYGATLVRRELAARLAG